MKTAIILASIIAIVCAGFFAGYFLNLQSNTSDLPENLVITNVEPGTNAEPWTNNPAEYWIVVTVNNTGISNVNVVKLLFNNVKQDLVIPSMPISLAPDAGVVLNATVDITKSEYQTDALNIDVITSKGNTFSKVFTQSHTIGFMASSSLTITNIQFESGNQCTISVKNTGTNAVKIATVKVNNVAATVSETSILTYDAGDSGIIGIDLAWTPGNPYKFDIIDTSGQVVGSYQATAPG